MSDLVRDSITNGLEKLKKYMKLDEDYKFRLILAVLVNNRFEMQSKPILFLRGGWDTGKTTRGTFLLAVMNYDQEYALTSKEAVYNRDNQQVSPEITALIASATAAPSTAEEYLLLAQNSKALLFDNIDDTDNKMYSVICMLATGGRIAKRKLYTDNKIISSGKPVTLIYTGLNIVMVRPDVISRHIIIDIPPFNEDKEDEDVLRESFLKDLPAIRTAIEALYINVNTVLANYRNIPIPDRFRLRLFARIGCVINKYFDWPDFLQDYDKVISVSDEIQSSDEISDIVIPFVKMKCRLSGANGMYETQVTKMYHEIVAYNAEFKFICRGPSGLGMYLSSHKSMFDTNSIIVKYKKTGLGSEWLFRTKPTFTDGSVSWDEEEGLKDQVLRP